MKTSGVDYNQKQILQGMREVSGNIGASEVVTISPSSTDVTSTRVTRSGAVKTHNAVTTSTTSAEIDLSDYAYVMIRVLMAGTPTTGAIIKVHGAFATADTAVEMYTSGAKTASFASALIANPGFVKVEIVRTDATWTIEIQGVNP